MTGKTIPNRRSKGSGTSPRAAASRARPARSSRQEEADIAVSERLIRRERPIPLKKILKEFGR